eukprot:CAMPEP_0195025298 /NCGR_PEP_ID=MMETSP0326_2-20130528/47435_1 /TAXON_ID=2866 ORGANISM="Crypthecodinium cohnii, Strain Seligo" /NCGR_SAMPLE_ID=MMETSP0326_2 /ASSEMBLY_ACC=CAM_ASM_000348 /LENGTH=200 /DNA_ID=CAMNT_0040046583 /DNA_START=55 /DNA_END=659 /DNA_ORIENTATION=-
MHADRKLKVYSAQEPNSQSKPLYTHVCHDFVGCARNWLMYTSAPSMNDKSASSVLTCPFDIRDSKTGGGQAGEGTQAEDQGQGSFLSSGHTGRWWESITSGQEIQRADSQRKQQAIDELHQHVERDDVHASLQQSNTYDHEEHTCSVEEGDVGRSSKFTDEQVLTSNMSQILQVAARSTTKLAAKEPPRKAKETKTRAVL